MLGGTRGSDVGGVARPRPLQTLMVDGCLWSLLLLLLCWDGLSMSRLFSVHSGKEIGRASCRERV